MQKPDETLVQDWQSALTRQVNTGELSETMKRSYEWGFAQYIDWLHQQQTGSLATNMIQEWIRSLEDQGYNSFSLGFWVDSVKSFYEWAYREGRLMEDPTRGY